MHQWFRRAARIAAIVGLTVALGACGASGGDSENTPVVFAASSLTNAFNDLETSKNAVTYFGGSAALVDQLIGGAPADVFASADTANMERAAEEGLIVGEAAKFATNGLILVTPPQNPGGVSGLDDSLDGVKLVVCAAEVPCGRASFELAADLGVELDPVSEELSVTDVLGKVTSGEADAGLVYTTDAMAAGDKVNIVAIPQAADHLNDYWIALVAGGNETSGQAFIDAVLGPDGQRLLAEHGFGAP